MKFLIQLFLGLILSAKAQSSFAQHQYQIKGKIVDSVSGNPVGYATISVGADEGQPAKSVRTADNGTFVFSQLQKTKYTLSIVSIGYQAIKRPVDLSKYPSPVLDLGTIRLSASSNNLKEVVVTGEKPLIKQEIDRITYDLQADPESKGSNVLEMMRKVPMLSLDAEDNIQLKGNSNFRILINGKPSSMMERNPKDILRSMPASSIQRIEVITNPPAKYDGEGLAGIINIITVRKIDNGYNGSVNLSNRFPLGGPGAGGSLGIKYGKLGVSANAGGSYYNVPVAGSTVSRVTLQNNPTSLAQQSSSESDSRSGYFGTELSYEPDTLHLISVQFNLNGNNSENNGNQQSLLRAGEKTLQSYKLKNQSEASGNGMDAALNYQLGFKNKKDRLLTFSYRYYNFGNKQNNNLTVLDQFSYSSPDYRQDNDSESSEQTLQLDYVHPVKKLNIEGGIKAIFRSNTSEFGYDYLDSSGFYIEDPARTNNFDNTQRIFSVYNSYQYSSGDWGFKAGVRVEQTNVDADFTSAAAELNKDYFTLLPSVSLSYKFKNQASLNLGYNKRIQRPGIYQLNPFVDRSNPEFETSGNPEIEPGVYNQFQAGYSSSKKLSVFLSLSYMYSTTMIFRISSYDSVSGITRSSYQNTGNARLPGMNYNIKYPITKKSDITLNGWMGYGMVRRLEKGLLLKQEGLMYNFNSSVGFKPHDTWYINAAVYLSGGNLTPQGSSNSYLSSSFRVNKDLVKNKLSLSASASNPFTKYRTNRVETSSPDFIQVNDSQNYFRVYNFSLNYRFGKLKEALKQSKRGIKNDDVSSGGGL